MSDLMPRPSGDQPSRWRPVSSVDRRVLGVLVEKAKTTPEQYPLTQNAIRSGANQKSSRYPLMELELDDIEESLGRLRDLGAVAEVQGGGRVSRYRHYMYEWLGVDKVELAVMAELLLRGAQTEGELRGRAARMEPISDVAALRPVLNSLKAKGLVLSLTPEGRGHMVTHALYEERELDKVRAEAQRTASALDAAPHASEPRHESASAGHAASHASEHAIAELRQELDDVRAEVAKLRSELDELLATLR